MHRNGQMPVSYTHLDVYKRQVFTRANEHGKAVAMFTRAVELFPQHATFRFNLATSLTFAGRLEEGRVLRK